MVRDLAQHDRLEQIPVECRVQAHEMAHEEQVDSQEGIECQPADANFPGVAGRRLRRRLPDPLPNSYRRSLSLGSRGFIAIRIHLNLVTFSCRFVPARDDARAPPPPPELRE